MKKILFASILSLIAIGSAPNVRAQSTPQTMFSVDSAMSTCDYLLRTGYLYQSVGEWKESYDTLRLFIEQCPFYVGGAYNNGVLSWQVFGYVNGAISQWAGGGVGRWPDYLSWLKKVLYLNPDSMWYCWDVQDMITAEQQNQNAKLAALKYVLQNHKCDGYGFETLFTADSNARYQHWLDSLKELYRGSDGPDYQDWSDSTKRAFTADTSAHPFDTTIPSLFDVDLQILMGSQYASAPEPAAIGSQALVGAKLLENPMTDEIAVSFEMGRTALVTFELRDVLGRAIPLTYAKYQLEQPGPHEARIAAPDLPPGTYYLRVTTDIGETLTLKVVKE